jgi:steroid delta-isomerase-like uncharacterized protein
MTVVQEYAEAKSRADVEAALAVCTEGFVLETVPFQLTAVGKHEARMALGAFFTAFPDYEVTLDGLLEGDGKAVAWGVVRATMWGDLLSQAATGRAFELPMSCVFRLEGGRLASESFLFDLNQMCEQLGLDTGAVAADLRHARRALETTRLKEAA